MLLLFLYWRFRRSERQLGMQPDEASTGDSEAEMNSSELDALVPLLIANKKFVHSRNQKTFHRLLCRAERRGVPEKSQGVHFSHRVRVRGIHYIMAVMTLL